MKFYLLVVLLFLVFLFLISLSVIVVFRVSNLDRKIIKEDKVYGGEVYERMSWIGVKFIVKRKCFV